MKKSGFSFRTILGFAAVASRVKRQCAAGGLRKVRSSVELLATLSDMRHWGAAGCGLWSTTRGTAIDRQEGTEGPVEL